MQLVPCNGTLNAYFPMSMPDIIMSPAALGAAIAAATDNLRKELLEEYNEKARATAAAHAEEMQALRAKLELENRSQGGTPGSSEVGFSTPSPAMRRSRKRKSLSFNPEATFPNLTDLGHADTKPVYKVVVFQILDSTPGFSLDRNYDDNPEAVRNEMLGKLKTVFPNIKRTELEADLKRKCTNKSQYRRRQELAEAMGGEGPMYKRIKGVSVKEEKKTEALEYNEPKSPAPEVVPPTAVPALPVPQGTNPPSTSAAVTSPKKPKGAPASYEAFGSNWVCLVRWIALLSFLLSL